MLELLSPEMLFNKQKVFHLNVSLNQTSTNSGLRKAVVVFNQPGETLPTTTKEMLDKLIQACRFKPEETVYVNAMFTPDISLGNLQQEYKPEVVLIFGEVSISRNIAKLKKNFVYDLSGVKVVNTDSLELLVNNATAKGVLWGVLKKMLGI